MQTRLMNNYSQRMHVGSMRHTCYCCLFGSDLPGHEGADLSLTCPWTHALRWVALLTCTSWAHAAQSVLLVQKQLSEELMHAFA